ncbi:mechanosensitive ion channel family protein [Pseudomonas benzenivorans]|uniref:Small-conductance mechanosensitive channel n=1 Tax=Pseudomonas benzenivorans TaxID=556533 RepID=A0ABY5H4E9_9PSED|nr:mechanosensitive ion channel domain-containing protein [Pseudomonas benzenivorans]UTW06968.1 mechanosensitive ion channel family protein [Pseudomonas benzenivorans]
MESVHFDIDAVIQRLLDEAYGLLSALPLLLLALLVVWLAWLVGRWLSQRTLLERLAKRNPFLRELARTTAQWAVTSVGVLVALEIMDATSLVGAVLGTAGVLGVALGFAFKETLENYLAGILMSLRQPFAPRDHVVIDGNEGLVIALTSRATILMTPDGNHLRLPNALVFRSVTLNYTRNPSRRFEFDVGLGGDQDLLLAQQLGIDRLRQLEGVMPSPPPRAFISALGDSNVQVRYHGWVDQRSHDFLMVKSEAMRQVTAALGEAGMDMPEPIYRLHVHEQAQPPAEAAAPNRKPPPATAAQADTRVITDLVEQIDQEQRAHDAEDLLDPTAPKE